MGTRNSKLISLLNKAKLQNPPREFTSEVIREIRTSAENKVYEGLEIKHLLKKTVLTTPPANFTYHVLNTVRGRSPEQPAAVINNTTWVAIGVFLFTCIAMALTNSDESSPATGPFSFISVGEYLNNVFFRFREPILYLATILLSGGALLLLESWINKKWGQNNIRSRTS